jgi:hypothetical protein
VIGSHGVGGENSGLSDLYPTKLLWLEELRVMELSEVVSRPGHSFSELVADSVLSGFKFDDELDFDSDCPVPSDEEEAFKCEMTERLTFPCSSSVGRSVDSAS